MITVFLRNAKLQISYHLYIFCTKSEKDAFFLTKCSTAISVSSSDDILYNKCSQVVNVLENLPIHN